MGVSATDTERPDAIILGCVKTKRSSRAKAKDLYVSSMFAKRRRYAESAGLPWFIFSAEHGIIDPEVVIAPYDVAMAKLSVEQVRAKGRQAIDQLEVLVGPLRGKTFEIHAGADYARAIEGPLAKRGATLINPLRRLRFGPQLHWYDAQAGVTTRQTNPARRREPPATRLRSASAPSELGPAPDTHVTVDDASELQSFDFAWPEGPEHFDRGWAYTASIGSMSFQARHGIGGREVYGRYRVHSVTWLDGQPMVEGVAADDYAQSGSLLSTLRIEGRAHVRDWSELPIGYAGFTIVRQSDEIVAKYSRRSLAVKILEDDLAGWARHAILRAQSKGPGAAGRAYRKVVASLPTPAATLPSPPDLDRSAVVRALLELAEQEKAQLNKSGEPFFTPNALANRFLIENPLAFLLAVIFDQGIVAERAWAAPYELAHRLGHLDPYRLEDDLPGIAKAVATPPMLQRFVNTIPPWIASAARRVVREYGGDAGRIWGDAPRAEVLDRRLRAFDGIGQKKAAMAVEMLERDLKVPIKGLHGTDIAYDVHVRRVFLRTGLADRDDRDHMVAQGRLLNPSRPGAIDFPMWLVGRRWCRPGVPSCPECALFSVCPRLVDRAEGVTGA
jgi:uncharacterized HhH-GPD family protein